MTEAVKQENSFVFAFVFVTEFALSSFFYITVALKICTQKPRIKHIGDPVAYHTFSFVSMDISFLIFHRPVHYDMLLCSLRLIISFIYVVLSLSALFNWIKRKVWQNNKKVWKSEFVFNFLSCFFLSIVCFLFQHVTCITSLTTFLSQHNLQH